MDEPPTPCINMVLLGDTGVGKSSIILSLITESFIPGDRIPVQCEPITIPKDVTPEQVETLIIDYSDREQSKLRFKTRLGSISSNSSSMSSRSPLSPCFENPELQTCLQNANVILLVYSVDDTDHKNKLSINNWLNRIRSVFTGDSPRDRRSIPPVILVGNKTDLKEEVAFEKTYGSLFLKTKQQVKIYIFYKNIPLSIQIR